MKKYILSVLVIIVLVAYTLYSKMTGVNPVVADQGTSTPPTTDIVTPPVVLPKSKYKDGEYTGSDIKFIYGQFQVSAVISSGKLADMKFLKYPNDNPNSTKINESAMSYWRSEAISVQAAKVDILSGATDSTVALNKSLGAALAQALN